MNPHNVSVAWLQEHLGDRDLIVVDATSHNVIPTDGSPSPVSGHELFLEKHIPGAVFADLLGAFADPDADQVWTVPTSERFAHAAGALGIGDGVRVVVYDRDEGFWATRFWWHLRLEGFTAVSVLDGGLQAWVAAELPTTACASTPTPREFVPDRRSELIRSTAEVFAALDDESTVLVNVMDEAAYRGDSTAYARQGPIPGSINVPVADLWSPETGELRPVEDLRRELGAAGLLDSSKNVVAYCGGGIAATAIAHALALLGRSDVAIYAGSMRAWSADPDLPLVNGELPR
jgi:thiosulfate/3-mercaptopyruvate sulfurtransferase